MPVSQCVDEIFECTIQFHLKLPPYHNVFPLPHAGKQPVHRNSLCKFLNVWKNPLEYSADIVEKESFRKENPSTIAIMWLCFLSGMFSEITFYPNRRKAFSEFLLRKVTFTWRIGITFSFGIPRRFCFGKKVIVG